MSENESEMRVVVGPQTPDGLAEVTVWGPDGPFYVDRIHPGSANERQRFVAAMVAIAPGLDQQQLHNALMSAAARSGGRSTRSVAPPDKKVPECAPFPIHFLPEPVQEYATAIARSVCVDESMAGLALWVVLGGAIGLSRKARIPGTDWTEYPVVWGAIVSPSGGGKSPLLDAVMKPVFEHQLELKAKYDAELAQYEIDMRVWTEKEKRRIKSGVGTAPPTKPILQHVYASDTTIEAMVDMFNGSPHGIIATYDELVQFFGLMGRYNGKEQADLGRWLSLFSGTQLKIDRKTTGTTIIETALASVIGGIQTRILKMCVDEAALASGLIARFLFVAPRMRVQTLQPGVPPEVQERFGSIVRALFQLPVGETDEGTGLRSRRAIEIPFAPECMALLHEDVPDWSADALAECETIEAAMRKMQAYRFRFALIRRVVREVVGLARPEDPISLEDLEAGIGMIRYFKDQLVHLLGQLEHDTTPAASRTLDARVEIVRAVGGEVTVNKWRTRSRKLRTKSKEEATAELQALVDAGLAEWGERSTTVRGGRPTTVCRLIASSVAPQAEPNSKNEEPSDEGQLVDDGPDERGFRGFWLRVHAPISKLESGLASGGDVELAEEGVSRTPVHRTGGSNANSGPLAWVQPESEDRDLRLALERSNAEEIGLGGVEMADSASTDVVAEGQETSESSSRSAGPPSLADRVLGDATCTRNLNPHNPPRGSAGAVSDPKGVRETPSPPPTVRETPLRGWTVRETSAAATDACRELPHASAGQSSGDPFVDDVKSLFEDRPAPPPRPTSRAIATQVSLDLGHADELPWDVLLGNDADARLRGDGGAA